MTANSHLEIPQETDCAFCAYLRGDRPYTILSRDEVVATLVTREQRGLPHLLVIPVRHAPTILDLTDAESITMMRAVRTAAVLIDSVEKRPGIAIWQKNGLPAAQTIGHVHFHVAGTLPGGGTVFGDVKTLSVSQTDAIAARLRGCRRKVTGGPLAGAGD